MAEFNKKKCEEYLSKLQGIQMAMVNQAPGRDGMPPESVANYCRTVIVIFDEIKKEQSEFAQKIWSYLATFDNVLRDLYRDRVSRIQAHGAFQEALKNLIPFAQGELNKFSDQGFSQITTGQNIVAQNTARQTQIDPAASRTSRGVQIPQSIGKQGVAQEQSSGEMERLRAENNKLQNQLQTASQNYGNVDKLKGDAQSRIRQLETQIATSGTKLVALETAHEQVVTAKNQYFAEKNELSEIVKKHEANIRQLVADRIKFEERIKSLTAQVEAGEVTIPDINDFLTKLKGKLPTFPPTLQKFLEQLIEVVQLLNRDPPPVVAELDFDLLDQLLFQSPPGLGRLMYEGDGDAARGLTATTRLQAWAVLRLGKIGIGVIFPKQGETFDPKLHTSDITDALWVNDVKRHNQIAAVKKPGFQMDGKVIKAEVKRFLHDSEFEQTEEQSTEKLSTTAEMLTENQAVQGSLIAVAPTDEVDAAVNTETQMGLTQEADRIAAEVQQAMLPLTANETMDEPETTEAAEIVLVPETIPQEQSATPVPDVVKKQSDGSGLSTNSKEEDELLRYAK